MEPGREYSVWESMQTCHVLPRAGVAVEMPGSLVIWHLGAPRGGGRRGVWPAGAVLVQPVSVPDVNRRWDIGIFVKIIYRCFTCRFHP